MLLLDGLSVARCLISGSACHFLVAHSSATYKYTGLQWRVVWVCDNQTCPPPTSSTDAKVQGVSGGGAAYDTLDSTQVAIRDTWTQCCEGGSSLVSECVQPNASSCCNGIGYSPFTSKCCTYNTSVVLVADACNCSSDGDCDGAACCLPTKYSELSGVGTGECYNTTDEQCCDTGEIFDPGSEQVVQQCPQ